VLRSLSPAFPFFLSGDRTVDTGTLSRIECSPVQNYCLSKSSLQAKRCRQGKTIKRQRTREDRVVDHIFCKEHSSQETLIGELIGPGISSTISLPTHIQCIRYQEFRGIPFPFPPQLSPSNNGVFLDILRALSLVSFSLSKFRRSSSSSRLPAERTPSVRIYFAIPPIFLILDTFCENHLGEEGESSTWKERTSWNPIAINQQC
jgi:hypothetical protein